MLYTIFIGLLSISFLTVAGGCLRVCDGLSANVWEENSISLISLFCGFMLMGLCLVRVSDSTLSSERDRAVEAGVAHYVADSKTGEVAFEYIKQGDENE